ncbi:MAG: pentapeptide repeat-containing protein [Microscillaceae bacterium]|nr:pentapeptide repeat-containing protein [Microscillaceae bacterium]
MASDLESFKKELLDLINEGKFNEVFAKIKSSKSTYDRFTFNTLEAEFTFDIELQLINRLKVFIGTLTEETPGLIARSSDTKSDKEVFYDALFESIGDIIKEYFHDHRINWESKEADFESFLLTIKEKCTSNLNHFRDFSFYDFNDQNIIRNIYEELSAFFDQNDLLTFNLKLNLRKSLSRKLKIDLLSRLEGINPLPLGISSLLADVDLDAEKNLVRALSDYEDELQKLYQDTINAEKAQIALSSIYVEPNFSIHTQCFDYKDSRHREASDEGFINVIPDSIHQYLSEVFHQRNPAQLPVNTPPRLILVQGYPGQGKTSFIKRFVHDLLEKQIPCDKEIFYLKLKYLKKREELIEKPLETLLDNFRDILNCKELSIKHLKNSLLLLDGLNELAEEEKITPRLTALMKQFIGLCDENKNLKIIITCRSGYLNPAFLKCHAFMQILQIDRFKQEQQITWLNKYKTIKPSCTLTEKNVKTFNQTENGGKYKYRQVAQLLEMPIFLHYIVNADINFNKPKHINAVYVFEKLLEKLVKEIIQDHHIQTNGIKLLRILREIAFGIHISPFAYTSKKEIIDHLKLKEEDIKILEILIDDFYFKKIDPNYVKEEVFLNKGDFIFTFLHSSFREYLIAEKIWNDLLQLECYDPELETDQQKVFNTLFTLFSRQKPNLEIVDYFVDILLHKRELKKPGQLREKLNAFLGIFLNHDFKLKQGITKTESVNIFYGMCLTISYLNLKGEFFNQLEIGERQKFVSFLKQSYYPKINLSYLNFDGLDLSKAELQSLNLSNSSFKSTNLHESNLSGANLRKTVFENADLSHADLSLAYLSEANFTNALLESTDLTGAKTSKDTDFMKANLKKTTFCGMEGLNTAKHLEHAYIDKTDFRDTKLNDQQLKSLKNTNAILDKNKPGNGLMINN